MKCRYQRGPLSPLLFCLAPAPLSNLLHSTNCGYDIQGKKINHLFYMDDIKVFGRDSQQQERSLKIVLYVAGQKEHREGAAPWHG